jgi:acid phosphatase
MTYYSGRSSRQPKTLFKSSLSPTTISTMKGTAMAMAAASAISVKAQFNPLHHLGGNSPWFSGQNVFDISPEAPEGCSVDTAAFASRHGSRYPDPGAYNGWLTLSEKV